MKKVLGGRNRKVNNKTVKRVPRLKILQKIIDKNLYLFYMNEEVRKAFTPKPMIWYEVLAISVVI